MTRVVVFCTALVAAFVACGESEGTDQVSPAGGATGQAGRGGGAGQRDDGRGGQGGSSAPEGGSAGASDDAGGSGGSSVGSGGSLANGGSSDGAAGSPSTLCVFPETIPTSGAPCPEACEGQAVAYEDCEGDGLVQAACAGDWFLIQQECGESQCENFGFEGMSCGSGFVCVEQVGGAQFFECRPHECGTGPITCDCLGISCSGVCTRTGMLDFHCNTCPEGNCP